MPNPAVLQRLVSDVGRQVRLRRAEYYGLRGTFYGVLIALVPLLLREMLGITGLGLAAGLMVAGGLAGVLYGLSLHLPAGEAARLADRGYGLQDRVATALEWSARPDRTPLVDALVADAVSRVERLEGRRVIRRRVPREARLIPLPLLAGLLLAISPPLPLPRASLPNFSVAREEEDEDKPKDRAGELETSDRTKAARRDPIQRADVQERNLVPRMSAGGPSQPGDLSAIFKDTSLGGKAPDFNSFLKKGDERIRMLEQLDRLPDLQQDYTQRQTRVIFQRAKALRDGVDPSKVSPEKLRELLNEMERLGRKGGPNNWSGDLSEGMEALEGGQTDKALDAMERALSKMRSMEEKGRDGKGLRGGRESDRRTGLRGRDRGAGPGGPGDEGDFPEGEGLLPGRGKSSSPKGDPTQRLRGNPFDVGVEGEVRSGRRQGIDTNMIGRGANMPSRLQYLGVLGQYRKMMEESIAREQVPRDFQSQVKEYFQALDEK
jgi:hypothetical protein